MLPTDRSGFLRAAALFTFLAAVDSLAYLNVIAGVGGSPPPPPSFWAAALTTGLSSQVLWMAAATFVARSKGRSGWWCLAGLLTCCGVFLVLVLPEVRPSEKATEYEPGDYPRPRR